MNKSDLLYYQACEKPIILNNQCKTENGIERDESFIIVDIIGNFDQIRIRNQYNQTYVINPNQLI